MVISAKILKYNFFMDQFIDFVTTPDNILRYGLTTTQVDALNVLRGTFQEDFKPYVNPLFNNPVVVNAMNTDYQNLFIQTQSVRFLIQNNPNITLSSQELAICQLKKHSKTTNSGAIPKMSPAICCIIQSSMMLTFIAVNPKLPFKKAKPFTIGLKMAITEAGAPAPGPEDYIREENEEDTKFEMLFNSSQVGKTCYLIGFYIDSKGNVGKDGIPCIVTII